MVQQPVITSFYLNVKQMFDMRLNVEFNISVKALRL